MSEARKRLKTAKQQLSQVVRDFKDHPSATNFLKLHKFSLAFQEAWQEVHMETDRI